MPTARQLLSAMFAKSSTLAVHPEGLQGLRSAGAAGRCVKDLAGCIFTLQYSPGHVLVLGCILATLSWGE